LIGIPEFKNLSGQTFGLLTVMDRTKIGNRKVYYECKCACGNTVIVESYNLKSGHTKSCGCIGRQKAKNRMIEVNTTHGMTHTRFYSIYCSMKKRCKPYHRHYKDYGGRGIFVCSKWEKSFENFKNDMYESYLDHVNKFGENNTSIDRIDTNESYCKENCRWSTNIEQNNNKRNTRYFTYNGECKPLRYYSTKYNINLDTLCSRIYHNWKIEDAINKPIQKRCEN